jgi:hypothetical protein
MSLADDRKAMIATLKQVVIPRLRALGFQGSFPHFRRLNEDRTDLLLFQFDKYGGGFVVELGTSPPGDFVTSWDEHIPAKKLEVSYLEPDQRHRLGAVSKGEDHWFRYDHGRHWRQSKVFKDLAQQIIQLVDEQAVPWWEAAQHPLEPTAPTGAR